MAKYHHDVSIPFSGYVLATVELDTRDPSAEEILAEFYETSDYLAISRLALLGQDGDRLSWPEIAEWTFNAHVAQGNMCYAPLFACQVDYTESLDGADD